MKRAPKKSTVWAKCSRYNRQKDADHAGYVACVSCGQVKHWKEMDCGHFYPRGKKALFWVPENLHAQCKACNMYHIEKAKIAYTKYMIDRYGREFVDNLEERAKGVYRERAADLIYWNDFYKRKLEELE